MPRAMRRGCSNDLGTVPIELIDGRCRIGIGGETPIHVFLVFNLDCINGLDGTQILPRDGSRHSEHLQGSEVSKPFGNR